MIGNMSEIYMEVFMILHLVQDNNFYIYIFIEANRPRILHFF